MTALRRLTGILLTVCCGLIAVSIVLGDLSDAVIVTGNMEIESQVYTVFVEDTAHMRRVDLAGTHCFEDLPPWVYPAGDPARPPIPDAPKFFWERVKDVIEVLTRCRP